MSLSRRSFFANLAGGTLLPVLAAEKKAPPLRPNIVLITVDNLGSWMLGLYGNKEIRTPNLDTLGRAGTRFTYGYAASPVASVNLGSLLSGRTARQLGDGTKPLSSEVLLSDLASAQGYNCGWVGRWADGKPGHGNAYAVTEEASGDAAAAFLARQSVSTRFLLTVNFSQLTAAAPVAAKFRDLYAKSTFDAFPRPAIAANARNKAALKDTVAGIRKTAAALSAIDEQAAIILAALKRSGVRDNTIIAVTGNAGLLMGQHGLWGDGRASDPASMFDECTAVPTFWNWPGKIPVELPRPNLVGACDLLPTLADLIGAPLPARNLCGRSYLPLVLNLPMPKKQPWINLLYATLGDVEMARDARFKLVQRTSVEEQNEFFDMRAPLPENINQYNNAQFITVRDDLAAGLAAWKKKYSA